MDHYQLDFATAEDELAAHAADIDLSPEDYFHREWVRWMFTLAVDACASAAMSQAGRSTFNCLNVTI